MKCEIIGKKIVNFKNDKGDLVQSLSIYVTHRLPKSNEYSQYDGKGCSEVKCPFEYSDELLVGLKVDLDFDANGKLLEIILDDD